MQPFEVQSPPDEPTVFIDIQGSVRWAHCDEQATRRLRGDFMVSLWQWDARVTSDSGTQPLPSGQEPLTPGGQAPGYPYVTASRDRQVFLKVTNGDFLLPQYGGNSTAYLFEPRIHAAGSLTLEGVTGYLAPQARQVQGERVDLAGNFTVIAGRGDASRIPLQVESVPLGGGAAPTAVAGSAIPPWAWAAGLLALAAVPAALALLRRGRLPRRATRRSRRRALALFDYAETSAFENDHRRAVRLLDRAIRLEGLRPDFFALRARCRAALDDTEGALRDHLHAHEAFPATEPDALASNAFEAARTCARAGRRDAALSWLLLAVQYDPHCGEDARDDPLLLPLLTPEPGLWGRRGAPASGGAAG